MDHQPTTVPKTRLYYMHVGKSHEMRQQADLADVAIGSTTMLIAESKCNAHAY